MRSRTRAGLTAALCFGLLAAMSACNRGEAPSGAKGEVAPKPKVAGQAAGVTAKGPKLEVAEATFDAGKVPQGEKVKHTFVLRNVGTDVLHIKRAKGT